MCKCKIKCAVFKNNLNKFKYYEVRKCEIKNNALQN